MSNANQNTNNTAQTSSSNIKDYFELLKTHYKAILGVIIAAIPVLGAVFTFFIYLYQKSYLDYFGVSVDWIEVELSESIFDLIYSGCLGLILLLPNTITLAPLLFHKETRRKVKSEFFFTLIGFIIVLISSFFIKQENGFLLTLAIWIVSFELPVILSFMLNCINAIIILITHPIRTFKYIINHAKNIKFRTIFQNIANGIDKINEFYSRPTPNVTEEDRIKNKNIALYILVIFLIFCSIIAVLLCNSFGNTTAEAKTSFSLIELSKTEEIEILDETHEGNPPYIQNNKRIVNSQVVLTENDKYYLIANAYLDNKKQLFIFSSEQKIIEKKDVPTILIKLSSGSDKAVISWEEMHTSKTT